MLNRHTTNTTGTNKKCSLAAGEDGSGDLCEESKYFVGETNLYEVTHSGFYVSSLNHTELSQIQETLYQDL